MRLALMIEGQEGATWEDWVALADACERSGVEALFSADHYGSVAGSASRDALDAWGVLTALAARTSTLRLGTMVSPASIRHPSVLAKLVTTADHVSGGRIELGMGAGWWEPEHKAYGLPFRPLRERLDVLEEQLAIVHDGHWGKRRTFSFQGDHYTVERLDAQPRPVQRPHPPLIVGGLCKPRSVSLAALYADAYNVMMPRFDQIPEMRAKIEAACKQAGRPTMPLGVMTTCMVGRDEADLAKRVRAREVARDPSLIRKLGHRRGGGTIDVSIRGDVWITGTVEQVIERLRAYAAAGVERVFLQHTLHRDLGMVELIGRELAPAVRDA
ncbi:MAG: LLM class flavin-dependent oxidoreductase [Conexibacter sp.]